MEFSCVLIVSAQQWEDVPLDSGESNVDSVCWHDNPAVLVVIELDPDLAICMLMLW